MVTLWADLFIFNICPMEVLLFTHVYTSTVIPIITYFAIKCMLVVLDLLLTNRAGKGPRVRFYIPHTSKQNKMNPFNLSTLADKR